MKETADTGVEQRTWYVYALKDPRTDAVKYVGRTYHPHTRFLAHKGLHSYCETPTVEWIRNLAKEGLTPLFQILETGDDASFAVAEQRWVSHYLDNGDQLTNRTIGSRIVEGERFKTKEMTMRKTYFDNDLSKPEGFSSSDHHSWLARMLGSASVHIDPETWNRLRKEAAEDVSKFNTLKEVSR